MIEATVPDATVTLADGAGPDTRTYRVSFAKVASRPARLRAAVDRPARHRGAARAPTRAHGLTIEDFLSSRFQRIMRIRELLDTGALDADLRWRVVA